MGLLDDILGQVGKGSLTPQSNNSLLEAVIGMLTNQQSGGLGGLLQSFVKKGLGDVFSSWVSTGKNLPISPRQVKKVIGRGQVKEIAVNTGLRKGVVADALSKLLPEVVNQLTPKGSIEPDSLQGSGLDALKKIFG